MSRDTASNTSAIVAAADQSADVADPASLERSLEQAEANPLRRLKAQRYRTYIPEHRQARHRRWTGQGWIPDGRRLPPELGPHDPPSRQALPPLAGRAGRVDLCPRRRDGQGAPAPPARSGERC